MKHLPKKVQTRIKAPKYKVGRYSLNEYEVRNLMLEVASGMKPAGIEIKDNVGAVVTILTDGSLSGKLEGFDIADLLAVSLHRIRRKSAW